MILCTGGLGFIGSHLVDRLMERGEHVMVVDDCSTGSYGNKNKWADSIQADVGRLVKFCDQFGIPGGNFKVDLIYHLAAQSRIQPSFFDPQRTYESNSTGTWNVLEFARRVGCGVVYAGSSTACGDVYANPYAYTKHLGEEHCKLYKRLYGVKAVTARFFNCYGPRQIETGPHATVVGIFEKQRREGKSLTITGDGNQRRDFVHVSDIVDGLLLLGDRINSPDLKDAYQFGTGTSHSINEVATMFDHSVQYVLRPSGEEQETLADITDARADLGYNPKHTLAEYIKGTIQ